MAHSPGPFTADLGETYTIRDAKGGRVATISFLGHGGKFGGRRPDPEPRDNALLFAASPDLLKALDHGCLRELFGAIEDSGTPEAAKLWALCMQWFDVRDAAITKAKEGAKP